MAQTDAPRPTSATGHVTRADRFGCDDQRMSAGFLADAVLLTHAVFVAWVVFGVLAVWRWPRLAVLHLPALAWGIWIEVSGRVCPLTPLEVSLRREAGQSAYTGGFIDHYVGGILYPAGLTRGAQWTAAGLLVAVNVVVYGLLVVRAARRRRRAA